MIFRFKKIDRRLVEAIVSSVSAIICAVLAGCRLAVGNVNIKDFSAEIFWPSNTVDDCVLRDGAFNETVAL